MELKNIKEDEATNLKDISSIEEVERRLLTSDINRKLLVQYDKEICCFSSVFNRTLLWIHYGDKHKGIRVGYGLDRIHNPQLHKTIPILTSIHINNIGL